MIIYVGDYWVDITIPLVVGGFLLLVASLWFWTRKIRAQTQEKNRMQGTSAMPGKSGLGGR